MTRRCVKFWLKGKVQYHWKERGIIRVHFIWNLCYGGTLQPIISHKECLWSDCVSFFWSKVIWTSSVCITLSYLSFEATLTCIHLLYTKIDFVMRLCHDIDPVKFKLTDRKRALFISVIYLSFIIRECRETLLVLTPHKDYLWSLTLSWFLPKVI